MRIMTISIHVLYRDPRLETNLFHLVTTCWRRVSNIERTNLVPYCMHVFFCFYILATCLVQIINLDLHHILLGSITKLTMSLFLRKHIFCTYLIVNNILYKVIYKLNLVDKSLLSRKEFQIRRFGSWNWLYVYTKYTNLLLWYLAVV